eukprot:9166142-Pyramimonas_sp.AAC.1
MRAGERIAKKCVSLPARAKVELQNKRRWSREAAARRRGLRAAHREEGCRGEARQERPPRPR